MAYFFPTRLRAVSFIGSPNYRYPIDFNVSRETSIPYKQRPYPAVKPVKYPAEGA